LRIRKIRAHFPSSRRLASRTLVLLARNAPQ
jgi:hypothetical protein